MWRKKTGFKEFYAIVKEMPFLKEGKHYQPYGGYSQGRYIKMPRVVINLESLKDFIDNLSVDHLEDSQIEFYKIHQLNSWIRLRNYNATKEFRETRRQHEYFKRMDDFEHS